MHMDLDIVDLYRLYLDCIHHLQHIRDAVVVVHLVDDIVHMVNLHNQEGISSLLDGLSPDKLHLHHMLQYTDPHNVDLHKQLSIYSQH